MHTHIILLLKVSVSVVCDHACNYVKINMSCIALFQGHESAYRFSSIILVIVIIMLSFLLYQNSRKKTNSVVTGFCLLTAAQLLFEY